MFLGILTPFLCDFYHYFCNFNNIQIALRVGGIHQIITRDWQDVLALKFHEYMPVDRNLNYTLLEDGSSVCLILEVEYLLTELKKSSLT